MMDARQHGYERSVFLAPDTRPQLPLGVRAARVNKDISAALTQSNPSTLRSRRAEDLREPKILPLRTWVDWAEVPASILDLVLKHLRASHVGPSSSSCTTCYMRDLSSVQLTCKAWSSNAQRTLYSQIQIVGQEDPSMLRKWRLRRAARLIRLRATLRARPRLASLVKTIRVPDPNIPLYLHDGNPNPEYDAYLCTVASVVMVCPNLEALTEFIPFYNHTFDRLTHALSTRPKMRQHVWVVGENEDINFRCQEQSPQGLLDDGQRYQFLLYHERWKALETLLLCSPGTIGVIEHDLFVEVLHSLPSLKNLCVASFDADDFHNETLLSLPCVKSLRLEECYGVTDSGLMKWASSPPAAQVERLSLIHQNITSLLTISKMLASLDRLAKFSIVQTDVEPSLPPEAGTIVIQPVLASRSLRFLHWDVCRMETEECVRTNEHEVIHECIKSQRGNSVSSRACQTSKSTPNVQLALSVSYGGFPSLHQLRAPRDVSPPGILQTVCQPMIVEDPSLRHGLLDLCRFTEDLDSNSLRAARQRAQTLVGEMGNKQHHSSLSSSSNSLPDDNDCGGRAFANGGDPMSAVSPCETDFSASHKAAHCTVVAVRPRLESDPFLNFGASASYWPSRDSGREAVTMPQRTSLHPACDSTTIKASPAVSASASQSTCPRERNWADELHRQAAAPHPPATTMPGPGWNRPIFYLTPDIPGHDGNGGLVGWGDLLRVSEKAKIPTDINDANHEMRGDLYHTQDVRKGTGTVQSIQQQGMCIGQWNWNCESSQPDETRELVTTNKPFTSRSMTSITSTSENKLKSRLKSTSRLSLPLRRKPPVNSNTENRWRHFPRPTGSNGGCVEVEDFF